MLKFKILIAHALHANMQDTMAQVGKLEMAQVGKLEMAQVGKLEMAQVGNGPSWKWPKLEMALGRKSLKTKIMYFFFKLYKISFRHFIS